jgi:hypothetical protein
MKIASLFTRAGKKSQKIRKKIILRLSPAQFHLVTNLPQ